MVIYECGSLEIDRDPLYCIPILSLIIFIELYYDVLLNKMFLGVDEHNTQILFWF